MRHLCQFKTPSVNTVYHGKESVSFLKPEICEILPYSLKKMESIEAFKREIKHGRLKPDSKIPVFFE